MKKFLTPALIAALAVLLYNCNGDDPEALAPANEMFDSVFPGDSTLTDTVLAPPVDPIAQDTVLIPVDSVPGDSVVAIEPYPGEPGYPYPETPADSVYSPTDSISGQRMAYPRQQYLKH
jgi:hypothetical protein